MTDPRVRLPLSSRIGLGVLLIANLGRWVSGHAAPATQEALDAPLGLLYGIAIGCLLVGLAAYTRCNRSA